MYLCTITSFQNQISFPPSPIQMSPGSIELRIYTKRKKYTVKSAQYEKSGENFVGIELISDFL